MAILDSCSAPASAPFTSSWLALLWAVLIILTAINFVGTGEDKSADATAADGLTNDQSTAIANAL